MIIESLQDLTHEQVVELIQNHGLNLEMLIDHVVKYNGIVGVGLITLGENLQTYCHNIAKRNIAARDSIM
jgi:hypothetical protein